MIRTVEWTCGNLSGRVGPVCTQYTYDRNSNRLTRSNPQRTSLSEAYAFDGLDRLVDVDRNGANFKAWGLDSTANWNAYTQGAVTQTRTHNAANEVLTVSSQTAPIHDAAGNIRKLRFPTLLAPTRSM